MTPRFHVALVLTDLLGMVVAACGPASEDVAPPVPAGPPEHLERTGLYRNFATLEVAADCLPFEPQYPLWTDGATKRRWMRLPPGTWIDASDPQRWVFPVGTQLWKEFAFERPVETRYIERVADGSWRYATYVWSADGREACLAPECGVRRACETSFGSAHDIPSQLDCRACHEGSPSVVLGVGALQLSPDRDPLAPHAVTPGEACVDLIDLVERGLVRGLPDAWRASRIAARSERERAALGYLHANCSMCHNDGGPLAALDLSFVAVTGRAAEVSDAVRTTVGRESRHRLPDGTPARRIDVDDPDRSVLLQRMGSPSPFHRMPPLGTRVVDERALELVRSWVREDLAPRHREAHLAGSAR